MEAKKKKKIAIIVSIVSVILVIAIVGTFFIIKKSKNNPSNNQNASNVSMSTETKLQQAQIDIIENKIPQQYNGNYVFKYVSSISFNENLTDKQILNIVKKQKVTDANGLLNLLNSQKLDEIEQTNEKIVLLNGTYTKSHNGETIIEKGKFYGNSDLAEVRVKNKNNKYEKLFEMSLTSIKQEFLTSTVTSSTTNNGISLYIYRNFYNNEGDIILFTVTYVYELVEYYDPIIPDSKLDYEI